MTSFSAALSSIAVADYPVTYLFGVKDGAPDSYGKVPMANLMAKDASGFFPAVQYFGGDDWTGNSPTIAIKTTVSRALNLWNAAPSGSALLARVDNTAAQLSLFLYGTTSVGAITTNGTSTIYGTTSDYRLKEDVQPVATPLARLNTLNPVNFRWKSNGARVDGFIAHELATVVPESVVGVKDAEDGNGAPIYQGIDQSKLVPLLVAAVQELSAIVEAQEARLAALEAA